MFNVLNTIRAAVFAGAIAVAGLANAGTQVLGVELGVTTISALKQSAEGKRVQSRGQNKFSNGEMFAAPGAAFGVEGLKEVLYIFDTNEKLSAVVLSMDKHRFDAMNGIVAGKYKLVEKDVPFVGNKRARYTADDAAIILDAPHMSFVMEVTYVQHDLYRAFNAQSANEAAAKKQNEAAKF